MDDWSRFLENMDWASLSWLLLRLAAVCGGAVVQSGGTGPFTAALRLPLRPALPLRSAPRPEDLLTDRYSVLQIFLPGFCAGPNE